MKINFLYLLPRFVARRYSRVARGEIEHGPLSYNGRTLKICLVGADGVGPSTSFLSGKRSTAEPSARISELYNRIVLGLAPAFRNLSKKNDRLKLINIGVVFFGYT